jgi:hypothetical protein
MLAGACSEPSHYAPRAFMDRHSRRSFLKQTGARMATVASLPSLAALAPAAEAVPAETLPPHRALALDGVHAYADQESVQAGQAIRFQVSATVPYRMTIVRLGPHIDDPGEDKVVDDLGQGEARGQPIHPGSYVQVAQGLMGARALTLECWVRLWTFGRVQRVISQMDFPARCDFALSVGPTAEVSYYHGDGA